METYNILLICENCKSQNSLQIPKGATVEEYKSSEKCLCQNCGCKVYTPPVEKIE